MTNGSKRQDVTSMSLARTRSFFAGRVVNGVERPGERQKRIGYPWFDPKMIDNLFNSFTCHAVLGNGFRLSTRHQHKPNKFYGG
jgi:hypothetical protein